MTGESLASFYRSKRVLVTGHTGFKGGWLTTWLKMLGGTVIGLALPPDTQPNFFAAVGVDQGITSIFADIRDRAQLAKAFDHAPEIVFHMAAQPLVRRAYREPVETYATNVMGTVHLLEAVRQTTSVRSVVIVTSDKCYENQESSQAYGESDPLGGYDPYSSSKACAELVTAAYRRSFFSQDDAAPVASARAGNVIGGGDWSEDRLIPDIVRGIAAGAPTTIRRANSVRPWQHVLDPLRGYLMLAQCLWDEGQRYASAWNFGPREADALPVVDVARRFVALWGKGELQVQCEHSGPHEAQYLRLNCSKAEKQLGWRPALSLKQALEWTVEWYRRHYENPDCTASITATQIERYQQVAFP